MWEGYADAGDLHPDQIDPMVPPLVHWSGFALLHQTPEGRAAVRPALGEELRDDGRKSS
jgi:hypothetical protein